MASKADMEATVVREEATAAVEVIMEEGLLQAFLKVPKVSHLAVAVIMEEGLLQVSRIPELVMVAAAADQAILVA